MRILAPFPQRYVGSAWETCAQCGTSFEGGVPESHRCTVGEFACVCGCGNTGDQCEDPSGFWRSINEHRAMKQATS